jgi:PAS domain S-box-containing protein
LTVTREPEADSHVEKKMTSQNSSERYEMLYNMLFEAIPSSVLLFDRNTFIISANRNFLEKMRRSLSDTIGRRLEEVFPAIILDNIDFISQIREVFSKNEPMRGQWMTYRAPGIPMRIFYYKTFPFSWHGITESAMLLMDDVTEQVRLSKEVHRVERHLASVVESASDIVLSTDINGKILTWNTAAEKISGYFFGEVREHYFYQFCIEERQEEVKRIIAKESQHSFYMAEWDLVTKQGDLIPVSWVFSPMMDEFSQPVGIVAVGRNLTERRKFEMQLLQSQKLAALGVMAGGIAHEIRTPLAICSSSAQFLMEDDITPDFRKVCAEKINLGIQRASHIIENLLRFARPSTKTDFIQVSLLALINETVSLVANQARLQKVELSFSPCNEAIFINGIPTLLQQVFINLFLNAINAMQDGGTLSISVETVGNEGLICVTDTGHGISQNDIDKIFDPFYTTSPVGKGTGLGLSICYSIVKEHFGSIEVDSVEGNGTTFTVRLPIMMMCHDNGK